jgi:hypothetical protein
MYIKFLDAHAFDSIVNSRHCKNLTFLPFQHFSIQDILNEIPLPNLSLENLHLPYEAMNNRCYNRAIMKCRNYLLVLSETPS